MLAQGLSRYSEWSALFLRIAVGVIFIAHGRQKLFGGLTGFGQYLESLGVPLPNISALVVALVEFLGGIALLIGLFTRWAALLLAINMLMAILLVHLQHGLTGPGGFEFPLALLAATISLLLTGPQRLSVERSLFKREF
ncbi:MAG: DoxX family protein [Blastocatellia bacterium]|nr:DoxX family protein [Blastocatellia bacterium]MDW8167579.1 DoxX family protein [Acidobacteriota bacterium]